MSFNPFETLTNLSDTIAWISAVPCASGIHLKADDDFLGVHAEGTIKWGELDKMSGYADLARHSVFKKVFRHPRIDG